MTSRRSAEIRAEAPARSEEIGLRFSGREVVISLLEIVASRLQPRPEGDKQPTTRLQPRRALSEALPPGRVVGGRQPPGSRARAMRIAAGSGGDEQPPHAGSASPAGAAHTAQTAQAGAGGDKQPHLSDAQTNAARLLDRLEASQAQLAATPTPNPSPNPNPNPNPHQSLSLACCRHSCARDAPDYTKPGHRYLDITPLQAQLLARDAKISALTQQQQRDFLLTRRQLLGGAKSPNL